MNCGNVERTLGDMLCAKTGDVFKFEMPTAGATAGPALQPRHPSCSSSKGLHSSAVGLDATLSGQHLGQGEPYIQPQTQGAKHKLMPLCGALPPCIPS